MIDAWYWELFALWIAMSVGALLGWCLRVGPVRVQQNLPDAKCEDRGGFIARLS